MDERSGPASLVGVVGEQGHEYLRVGGPPAGDRVPAGPGLVAGDRDPVDDHRVVAGGDVVERLVVQRAAGDPVDGRVDEAERVAGLLVGEGDQPGPERRGGTGAALGNSAYAPPGAANTNAMPVEDEPSAATSGTPRMAPMPGTSSW